MKMNPFDSPFRVSLGSAVFFLGLVAFRSLSPFVIGASTGAAVVGFRVFLDSLTGEMSTSESLLTHLPAAGYYISFSMMAAAVRFRQRMAAPIRAGTVGAALDFLANACELGIRYGMGEPFSFSGQTIIVLWLFAILRSFCVIGVYNMWVTKHVRSLAEARKQELERLMMVSSGLYEEMFYLQKSMALMEDMTRKSYDLYSQLIERKHVEPRVALELAEHIHETKKDMQRIFAGLSKLIGRQSVRGRVPIAELCAMVIRANEKYASLSGKTIAFSYNGHIDLMTDQLYPLLSVLNNLVSNAVEAIEKAGDVTLHARLRGSELIIEVEDTGPGIAADDIAWIFQPGFTTKYDRRGNPSTGIGLTHARDIAQTLGGHLQLVKSEPGQTVFRLAVPTARLLQDTPSAAEMFSDRNADRQGNAVI
ncbi:sensor histidine kinase [Geobacillus zalihae]|uniref:histidine kinase n=2 Tax=Anoxybacillaceae TaxID=3120669 RepID=A0A7H1RZR7_9BACL|nr:ATP-binding protein [Geobacillus zalihae]QNU19756.1 sensor histidine kinase [Geobacillus zalihae]